MHGLYPKMVNPTLLFCIVSMHCFNLLIFQCFFARWLGFRLEVIGALLVLAAAIFAVVGRETGLNPGLVGLSISYALQVNQFSEYLQKIPFQ